MKTNHSTDLRLILATCFTIIYATGFAQQPVIRSVDKTNGGNGEVVTLQGTFPPGVTVSIGAAEANVQFSSDQLLEITVPAGATYDNIMVTDVAGGLSDYSNAPFLLSFGGNHGITDANLEGQRDFDSESGLYDLCMCDFDGDGKTDIATANNNANSFSLFANTTATPGLANIAFSKVGSVGLISTRSLHATCGDLNGDGRPDLVISEGGTGDRIFVFRNTSSSPGVFSFSAQTITLAGKKVKRVEIADLDNDGKPELIVTNQTGNNVTVLVNESTLPAISFNATHITLNISGAASTDGLAVDDLDGDGRPEIVTSQFLTATSNLFILKNTSIPGNISFAPNTETFLDGTVVNLMIGDLDGDQKPEIAATQLLKSGISIFKNQSTTIPDFAAPVSFVTDAYPYGIDFGDIDGDGKTDIVVASLRDAEKSITILNNESTATALDFSALVKKTTYINRHVRIGDLDGDGKPDIAFTSVDDNGNGIPASKVSVIRNKSCLVPELSPEGPIAICTGFPLQLTTTDSKGTTYEWKDGATTLATGADAFYDVTVTGDYSVTATGEGGTCLETSQVVAVTVDPGMTSGTAEATNDGPVCVGSTVSLAVKADIGGTAYNWTGPNGYTGTGLNPAPIPNFQAQNAGRYHLDVVVGGCIAQQTSTVVDVIRVPDFQVSYTGSDVICPPDTKLLSVVPDDPDFSYQWAERSSGNIPGADISSHAVTATGQYFVKAQYIPNPACATIETDEVAITFSTPPVADFTSPATACVGQNITFTNQSTSDGAVTEFYNWTFGDSQSSTDENPSHAYAAASTFTVNLKVSYNNGACESQHSENITIETAPAVAITAPDNNFNLCPGDSILLQVTGPFTAYAWNTGESTSSIYAKTSGTYLVDASTASCIITASADVTDIAGPVVAVSAEPTQVSEGGSSQLSASGLLTYEWLPVETLTDPLSANPLASPLQTTVYTVQGIDGNGCTGVATIEVGVKGDFIVNKLTPSKFISPENGDSFNNFWLIGNILDYPQCSVGIYDIKGIKVYEAKPYSNDWDGTFNGRPLPDGVYYYIIRCDGEENNPRSGSITLLR